MERLASRATSCVLASGPVLIFLLVSKAMTLILVPKSLPSPPREGIAGANAVVDDADDFQARYAAFGAFSPGILPFWACCRLLLGQRSLQLHGNSLSPPLFNARVGHRTSLFVIAHIVCGRLQKNDRRRGRKASHLVSLFVPFLTSSARCVPTNQFFQLHSRQSRRKHTKTG